MNEYSNFKVNSVVENKKGGFKIPNFRKLIKNPLIRGIIALVLVFVLIILFLSLVPLKKVTVMEKCIATNTNGNEEISYYSKDGRIEKAEFYNLDMHYLTKNYSYDKDGNILAVEHLYNGALFETEKYTYADGLLKEINAVSAENVILSKTVYTYTDGQLTLCSYFDESNKLISETQYKYDGKGRCVTEKNVSASGGNTVTTSYTYENNNMVKEEITRHSGEKDTIRYTYDKYQNVLSRMADTDDYTLYEYTYKTVRVPLI